MNADIALGFQAAAIKLDYDRSQRCCQTGFRHTMPADVAVALARGERVPGYRRYWR